MKKKIGILYILATFIFVLIHSDIGFAVSNLDEAKTSIGDISLLCSSKVEFTSNIKCRFDQLGVSISNKLTKEYGDTISSLLMLFICYSVIKILLDIAKSGMVIDIPQKFIKIGFIYLLANLMIFNSYKLIEFFNVVQNFSLQIVAKDNNYIMNSIGQIVEIHSNLTKTFFGIGINIDKESGKADLSPCSDSSQDIVKFITNDCMESDSSVYLPNIKAKQCLIEFFNNVKDKGEFSKVNEAFSQGDGTLCGKSLEDVAKKLKNRSELDTMDVSAMQSFISYVEEIKIARNNASNNFGELLDKVVGFLKNIGYLLYNATLIFTVNNFLGSFSSLCVLGAIGYSLYKFSMTFIEQLLVPILTVPILIAFYSISWVISPIYFDESIPGKTLMVKGKDIFLPKAILPAVYLFLIKFVVIISVTIHNFITTNIPAYLSVIAINLIAAFGIITTAAYGATILSKAGEIASDLSRASFDQLMSLVAEIGSVIKGVILDAVKVFLVSFGLGQLSSLLAKWGSSKTDGLTSNLSNKSDDNNSDKTSDLNDTDETDSKQESGKNSNNRTNNDSNTSNSNSSSQSSIQQTNSSHKATYRSDNDELEQREKEFENMGGEEALMKKEQEEILIKNDISSMDNKLGNASGENKIRILREIEIQKVKEEKVTKEKERLLAAKGRVNELKAKVKKEKDEFNAGMSMAFVNALKTFEDSKNKDNKNDDDPAKKLLGFLKSDKGNSEAIKVKDGDKKMVNPESSPDFVDNNSPGIHASNSAADSNKTADSNKDADSINKKNFLDGTEEVINVLKEEENKSDKRINSEKLSERLGLNNYVTKNLGNAIAKSGSEFLKSIGVNPEVIKNFGVFFEGLNNSTVSKEARANRNRILELKNSAKNDKLAFQAYNGIKEKSGLYSDEELKKEEEIIKKFAEDGGDVKSLIEQRAIKAEEAIMSSEASLIQRRLKHNEEKQKISELETATKSEKESLEIKHRINIEKLAKNGDTNGIKNEYDLYKKNKEAIKANEDEIERYKKEGKAINAEELALIRAKDLYNKNIEQNKRFIEKYEGSVDADSETGSAHNRMNAKNDEINI